MNKATRSPTDFSSAEGVVLWLNLNAMQHVNTGRFCNPDYPDIRGPKPYAGKNDFLELNTAMLLGVAELLRNETARNILHSIKLAESPPNKPKMMPRSDGKSCH
jgi:hypothetical protein